MKVSEQFSLGVRQSSLDFVDVDVEKDLKVFIDPTAIRLLPSDWGDECVSLIQGFFKEVLSAIHQGNINRAKQLLKRLHEPNETHLGVSRDKSKGKALGEILSGEVLDSLKKSEAVKSGLLEDLEDTILMIEGIGPDIISDITTNIIRSLLISYTQEACKRYNIPTSEFGSGPLWDDQDKIWVDELVQLPFYNHKRLIFVPKVIVRRYIDYDPGEYYRHYLLEILQEEELSANSGLVQLLKNGKKRVTKKSLIKKYGSGKEVIEDLTRSHPQALDRYRAEKRNSTSEPMSHLEISEATHTPVPDWDNLLNNVLSKTPGLADAYNYEVAVEQLLTALLYPELVYPKAQFQIHEGRKKVDIEYTNLLSGNGFFSWVGRNYPAPHIFFECKNYTGDLGNKEMDQLAGRFSPSRGKVGILVCRNFKEKKNFIQSCVDTAKDDRGFILVLDDNDLKELVSTYRNNHEKLKFEFFKDRFNKLIL